MNLDAPSPVFFAYALWALWLISWLIASAWSARAIKRPNLAQQAPDRIITGIGVILLFGLFRSWGIGQGLDDAALWTLSPPVAWAMTGLVAPGIAFTWWARLHLGRLWSGSITQKEDHRIVDTGPYALVRHPIYTGLILCAFATATLRANWTAYAGAGLILLGVYMKARLEERFLSRDLGEAYAAYRARVPMLIPLIGV